MLNWGMAALYVLALGLIALWGGSRMPFGMFALSSAFRIMATLPSAYLGWVIEKGRGRILQTIFAVLALFNFPLGASRRVTFRSSSTSKGTPVRISRR